jgi:hypothetical protein
MIVLDILEELSVFVAKTLYPNDVSSFSAIKMLAKPFCAWFLLLLGLSCFIWSFLLISVFKKVVLRKNSPQPENQTN